MGTWRIAEDGVAEILERRDGRLEVLAPGELADVTHMRRVGR
jgi:hypothetical protein